MASGAELARQDPSAGAPNSRRAWIGGVAWIGATVQFVIAMLVAQIAWTHPYNVLQNAISDLGAVTCGENPMGTSYVCSPLHVLFNLSIICFGLLVAAGALVARPAFPAGRVASTASATLVVAGLGAALVGVFPEDTYGIGHGVGALLAFVGSSLALILFGLAMTGQTPWARYRPVSLGCGAVSGCTIIASTIRETWGPIGFGGLERIILIPALAWLLLLGLLLVRRRH